MGTFVINADKIINKKCDSKSEYRRVMNVLVSVEELIEINRSGFLREGLKKGQCVMHENDIRNYNNVVFGDYLLIDWRRKMFSVGHAKDIRHRFNSHLTNKEDPFYNSRPEDCFCIVLQRFRRQCDTNYLCAAERDYIKMVQAVFYCVYKDSWTCCNKNSIIKNINTSVAYDNIISWSR